MSNGVKVSALVIAFVIGQAIAVMMTVGCSDHGDLVRVWHRNVGGMSESDRCGLEFTLLGGQGQLSRTAGVAVAVTVAW